MTKQQDTKRPLRRGTADPHRSGPSVSASPPRDGLQEALERALKSVDHVARTLLAQLQRLAPETVLDEFQVPVVASVAGGDLAERAAHLLQRLAREVKESLLAGAAFQRGRIYCLRCENSLCEHSLPPSPGHVFTGYGQTGRPEWRLLDQLLVSRQDPRLSRLYEDRREVLTVAMGREAIYERLLPGFEEVQTRYYILAQLCVGYFRPASPSDRCEPMALTVQVTRSQGQPDDAVVGINLVGRVPDTCGPQESLDDSILEGLHDALEPIRRELRPFRRQGGGRRPPGTGIALERLARRSLVLIREACRDLEHRRRVDSRRTQHARKRSQQGDRPTAKAFEEARQASDTRYFLDPQHRTVVVLGGHGRVHVFSPQGKHVTSVVYEGHEIQRRQQQKRWIPMEGGEVTAFRQRIEEPGR